MSRGNAPGPDTPRQLVQGTLEKPLKDETQLWAQQIAAISRILES